MARSLVRGNVTGQVRDFKGLIQSQGEKLTMPAATARIGDDRCVTSGGMIGDLAPR